MLGCTEIIVDTCFLIEIWHFSLMYWVSVHFFKLNLICFGSYHSVLFIQIESKLQVDQIKIVLHSYVTVKLAPDNSVDRAPDCRIKPPPRVRIPIWSVMIVSPIPLVMMSVLTAKVIWILLILIIFYLKHTYTKFTIHPLCIYIIFLVQMYIFLHFIKDPSD